MTDLIEVYPGAVDTGTCRGLIEFFENSALKTPSTVLTESGAVLGGNRRSESIPITPQNCPEHFMKLNACYDKVLNDYFAKYPVLRSAKRVLKEPFNVIRYKDSDEFYDWHVDGADPGSRYRMVSAVCYLNTVTEGGETEFRIHERRIKPQEGSLLLFPSPWPWDHRAHPPRSGPKYIITTWLRFGDFPPL